MEGITHVRTRPARVSLWRCVVVCLLFLMSGPAAAQNCAATMSNVSFGAKTVSNVYGSTTTATITEGCTAGFPTRGTLNICNRINYGSSSTSVTNRYLRSSGTSGVIGYQLYADPAFSTVFTYSPGLITAIHYSQASGGSTNVTVYAKIQSLPMGVPPGTYSDTYSVSSGSLARFGALAESDVCTNTAYIGVALTFNVSVTLLASCTVQTANLTFPTSGIIKNAIDATGSMYVSCTSTTPYNVGLSAGNGAGATVAARKMTGPGGATLTYSLYRESTRGAVWGTTVGSDTVYGFGNGSQQSYLIYGRVPVQITPTPGLYSDTVIVTVTY
ncbi:MAG: Csu type fimbrial protein [Methylocystis sp.]|uniref:Csu type fimbrial protein n=1 Tax=Methylocystis sp. TaxID=1911079 RepID=UPI003DA6ABB7